MNLITSRDNVSVTKDARNVKSKGNVWRTKNVPILAKSVTKPDHLVATSSNGLKQNTMSVKYCMIPLKNTKNPNFLRLTDDSNEVGRPKQGNTISSLDSTKFFQKHKTNLRKPYPRIFGTDISNFQLHASQMVDHYGAILSHKNLYQIEFKEANSKVHNMKQLANKDCETSNGSRGPLMEGKTQATGDIHIEGVVQLDNQIYRPLKKSIEDEDEQVEDRCSDKNVVDGEDDAARSTPQTSIWKYSQGEVHVPKPIDKPIWRYSRCF
ncbi:hypothetical protein HU200_059696 [Digitaria exilis]|uniref:Uncharacterized protein n=1 Tax=Digitaria exilis TaxID=1010633 RepID=A0A835DZJ6_9POAL|nr:hypothetical protein HU200_059696 [Digitaria exilis]